jgi:hypothetical protein
MYRALPKPALLAVLVILVGATAGAFLLRGSSEVEKAPEAPKAKAPAAKPEPAAKTGQPAKPSETPKTAAAPKAAETSKSGLERRQLLEAVGTLTAAHCYQSFLNLSIIADAKAKGTYTSKDAYKVLDSVVDVLDSVDRKLAALAKIDLDKDDRHSLEEMRDLSALLRRQAKELETFWDSGKDEDGDKYESTRKDAWAAIGKLTGIGR